MSEVIDVDFKEGKPKVQNIKITLNADAAEQAMDRMAGDGKLIPPGFSGPDFKDIKGYSLTGPFLAIQLHDDTQYVYPIKDIARIKTYITEQE